MLGVAKIISRADISVPGIVKVVSCHGPATSRQSCPFGGCQHVLEIALTLVLPMALFESCLISQFSQISKGICSNFPSVIPSLERRSLNG
jgi:hypothetical protein